MSIFFCVYKHASSDIVKEIVKCFGALPLKYYDLFEYFEISKITASILFSKIKKLQIF